MNKLIIISLIFLQSCSCNWYLEGAKRKCGGDITTKTITLHDTLRINSSQKDTIFKEGKDTVIIKEGRLTMKYFYNNHDSTVYLNGKCDTVFVVREIPVKVPVTEIKEGFGDWVKRFWYIPILLILIIVAIGYFKKK